MGIPALSPALLPMLMRSLGGGAGPGGPGAPGAGPLGGPGAVPSGPGGGTPPEAIGAAVSQEYAGLQGVDPGKILQDLNRYKQGISALFPIAVNRVADAARGISQAVVGLNQAIKAFEKAQQAVQQLQPLGLQSAQQNPNGGRVSGPLPQPTGMMP